MLNEKRAAPLDHSFQKLCQEAVVTCGPDLPAIERYVFERIDLMDEATRTRVRYDLERVLSYRAPSRSVGAPH